MHIWPMLRGPAYKVGAIPGGSSELRFSEYWRLIGELAKEVRKEKALGIRKK